MEAKNLARIKISCALMLAVIPLTLHAQNLVVPKKEFNLFCSQEALEFSRGDTGQLDIIILRSISYRKSKVKMGVSSILPKGVEITFNPDNDNFDQTKANIVIHANATPGQYLLILSATLHHKTKGSILKLTIK